MEGTLYPPESPAAKILEHLQRRGSATVKELEEVLGISTTAVREHLTHLQARDMITSTLVRSGPGRPRQVYSLTAKAQSLFPKAYDTLITLLLRELATREGPEQLQVLLDAVGIRMAEEYRMKVFGDDPVERLEALLSLLEEQGIPAEAGPAGDGFQLFACPYLDVAQEHAAVCTMERRMLEQVLGKAIAIEGTIREGQRSCHFTVLDKQQVPSA